MKSDRAELTPQMLQYAEKFDDRGDIRWLPYLMYFHATDHRSDVVNTDRLGFRIARGGPGPDAPEASVGGTLPAGPVRLLAGSSTAFGIGATCDAATIPSRLWARHAPSSPWLDFAGRSHNSTQELLLFTLYRHLLPHVDEIVILSGFNNLGLMRLPAWQRGDHGAFFNCGEFLEAMDKLRARHRKPGRARRRAAEQIDESIPDMPEQIALAAELTLRHLESWRLLTEPGGTRLTYVLQPLAGWVRPEPAPQEKLLFAELDRMSNFSQVYGDVSAPEVGHAYAEALQRGCEKLGVRFLDLAPVLAGAVGPRDWLFVDRIHFTDEGYDLVAALLAEHLSLT